MIEPWIYKSSKVEPSSVISAVRKAVQDIASGKAPRPALSTATVLSAIRYAPSFIPGNRTEHGNGIPYNVSSVAEMLGAIDSKGEALPSVRVAFSPLELEEQGAITKDALECMTQSMSLAALQQIARTLREKQRKEEDQE